MAWTFEHGRRNRGGTEGTCRPLFRKLAYKVPFFSVRRTLLRVRVPLSACDSHFLKASFVPAYTYFLVQGFKLRKSGKLLTTSFLVFVFFASILNTVYAGVAPGEG